MKRGVKIVEYRKKIYVFLNGKLFFSQKFLVSNNKFLSDKMYTLFYVFIILYRFGLMAPASRMFGY